MNIYTLSISLTLFTSVAIPAAYGIHSATVTAGAHDAESGQGDFDDQLGFTTASAQYSNPNGGSASGFATIARGLGGGFSMKAFATATGGSGEGQFVSNRGYASASWDDELRFRGTPIDALIEFRFSFSGSRSGDTLGSAAYSVSDAAGNFVIGGERTQTGELFFGIEREFAKPATYQINVSLSVTATGHGSGLGGPATSTADFSHSLTLMSITPLDANGNFIPGVTIESDSGFDYNALIQNIPEPSTTALLAIGCAAIVCRRLRAARGVG